MSAIPQPVPTAGVSLERFSQLLGVVAELTTTTAELARMVVQLREDHDRLREQFDGVRETNNLWDGS